MIKVHNPVNFQVSLKVLLKNKKDEVLLLQVCKGTSYPQTHDLPGGRINTDEISEEFHKLIDREIKEEVGNIKYKLRKDPVSLGKDAITNKKRECLFILFEATYQKGEVTISDEHSDFRWVKLTNKNYQKLIHPMMHELIKNYFLWNKN